MNKGATLISLFATFFFRENEEFLITTTRQAIDKNDFRAIKQLMNNYHNFPVPGLDITVLASTYTEEFDDLKQAQIYESYANKLIITNDGKKIECSCVDGLFVSILYHYNKHYKEKIPLGISSNIFHNLLYINLLSVKAEYSYLEEDDCFKKWLDHLGDNPPLKLLKAFIDNSDELPDSWETSLEEKIVKILLNPENNYDFQEKEELLVQVTLINYRSDKNFIVVNRKLHAYLDSAIDNYGKHPSLETLKVHVYDMIEKGYLLFLKEKQSGDKPKI